MTNLKTNTIILKAVKEIFKEIFKEQEQTLVNIVSNSSDLIIKTLHKLAAEIKEINN